jgi:hypothetical protein
VPHPPGPPTPELARAAQAQKPKPGALPPEQGGERLTVNGREVQLPQDVYVVGSAIGEPAPPGATYKDGSPVEVRDLAVRRHPLVATLRARAEAAAGLGVRGHASR